MKKYILVALLFCGSSVVEAQKWTRAYPTLNISHPYEFHGPSFRESYVQYRLNDTDEEIEQEKGEGGSEEMETQYWQEMEINIHDQVERSGFMPERVWNRYCGPDVPVARGVNDRDLRRIFALIAAMEINIDNRSDWWFLYPNFELLNDLIETQKDSFSKEKIAQAFKDCYPRVKSVYLWIGNTGYRQSRTSEISHIGFLGERNSWKLAFQKMGIELN